MEEKLKPCRYCKVEPYKKEMPEVGLFYVICPNCNQREVSIRRKNCIENWNENNANPTRQYNKAPSTSTADGGCSIE